MADSTAFFDFLRGQVNEGASDELVKDLLRAYEQNLARDMVAEFHGFMDGQGPPSQDWVRCVDLAVYLAADYQAPEPEAGASRSRRS